ncbi:hypothetical protein GCM10010168_28230 [Actinoplanes ianthinogenes]|uniref:Abortive infection protein n=1 Tax=Actinoplanes ianthinogenes TaxID=122358 RepID=A0ABM7LL73_9ACTN|nr:hypothetical protein [Actinoplanes ianthinogenes]BCJ39964.1 hypothetical protein Aiant_06210 [Actinoplanes ianthinogenes]GGR09327.1 hypothetical protein GCM10010168_28230 [Actinoplanes ianthinogenes]
MRGNGISYDTGWVLGERIGRPGFGPATVERDLRVIRDELHCTAVRVMGGDPDRLALAASIAADLGLEVWFSPYPLELTEDEMLALFAECAERAERLRERGAAVVFVAGAEISLMNRGFLPGDDVMQRVAGMREHLTTVRARVNGFLARAVAVVRERFTGPVTYAAVPVEQVDWEIFDILSVDLYRSAAIADQFAAGVRTLVAQGKPVAITEFGCATYRGAADRGAEALDAVVYDPVTRAPLRMNGTYERDEDGQAQYLRELLAEFEAGGVDSAFVFTFALFDHTGELDLASYGIVRVFDGEEWEPKKAFAAVAEAYS